MRLRTDLLKVMTDEDIIEEIEANNHRFRPEPLFSKTGVGSLSSASTNERVLEMERSKARIQRAMRRLGASGKKSVRQSDH